MLLDRLGPPGRGRGCRPHDGEVAGGAVADLVLLISGPRGNTNSHLRPREALNGHRSARCYGVAWHREGSRQNSIGGSGVLSLRHFGLVLFIPLSLGAWVPKNLARRNFGLLVSAGPRLQAARCRGRRRRRRRFRFIDFRAPR